MPALISWWLKDIRLLAPEHDADQAMAVGADLLTRWREPHRAYHAPRHLVEVFWALEEFEEADVIDERDAALGRVAGWFHDAVYAVPDREARNEADSAVLASSALARLGFDAGDIATVVRLVLASQAHEHPAVDGLDAAFRDADLWILAAPDARFDEYCAQVRREYAVVPDEVFGPARRQILTALIDAPPLYATAYAERFWSEAAVANLSRELSRLA